MKYKFLCYNCMLATLYLNCCEFGFLYYLISYAVFSILFYFLKKEWILKFIRAVLSIIAAAYFIYKLIDITNGFFDQKTLIVPIIAVVVYAVFKPFTSVILINKYAFVCGIIFLAFPCLMYLPQVSLKMLQFSSFSDLPVILLLTALPFAFDWSVSVKSFPVFLLLNYLFIYCTKEGMGLVGISESINIDFIFSSLELIFIFGLYLNVMPVIASCLSYFVDCVCDVYNKLLPKLKKHRLIIN